MTQMDMFGEPKKPPQSDQRRRFDLSEGKRRKDVGSALAAEVRAELLQRAKDAAYAIASERGTVTSDDVFRRLTEQGFDPLQLGNAAGSVFRGKDFEFTGRWEKSRRVTNHASDLRVWRLRDAS